MKPEELDKRLDMADGFGDRVQVDLILELKKLRQGLKEIAKWSPCYCLTDEESSTVGGKTCPTCIANGLIYNE